MTAGCLKEETEDDTKYESEPQTIQMRNDQEMNVKKLDTIEEVINEFYKKRDLSNNGVTEFLSKKSFKDNTLVLSRKYKGDGHSFTELFLIDNNMNIVKWATGHEPISMCFTINVIDYENTTIIFGSFNHSTWLVEPDERKSVKIDNIYVKYKNSESYREKVDVDKGYIVFSKGISEVEEVALYDKENILQSSLEDLSKYGHMFDIAEFTDVKLEE